MGRSSPKKAGSKTDSHYARRKTPHFSPPSDGVVGHYRIQHWIGKGAFGSVFKATSLRSKKEYALKVIKPVGKYVRNAKEEVAKLDLISSLDPKNKLFVRLFRSFDYHKNFVMVFELLGVSLLELIRKNEQKGLSVKCVAAIAREIFRGLRILHQNNLVHTDLKVPSSARQHRLP